MNTIQRSELAPIVAQIIGQPKIDALSWELSPIGAHGGRFAGVLGLVRLVGVAQAAGQTIPWSVVVKIIGKPDPAADPSGSVQSPSGLTYWRREILAYQSGILADLNRRQ